LTAYMDRPDREVYAHVRSHAYIALGDLVGRGGDEKGGVKARMIADLKNRRQKQWIHQSAVLALGQIAVPSDLDACKALMDYLASGKDIQAKNFCAIAIGQIGGPKNRAFLLGKLSRSKSYVKPWLALGIAVMDFNTRRTQPGYEGDMTAGFAVRQQFGKTKNPMYAAGMAVALGVMKNLDAGPEILERLHKVQSNEEPAGYLALSLGLMGYHDAKEDISALVERSTRRQKLLTQCSVALGLLGDKNISMKLVARMRDHGNVVAVQSALAQALGLIGDRRCIAHLTQTLQDKNYKRIPRAFAAVALGLVGDKEEFPWNSKIAVNNNYRATIEPLTGNGTGILDIL
ncbi:MAG: HEAT repeat domain-containing protein, partial [Planctomycetota bacterium]